MINNQTILDQLLSAQALIDTLRHRPIGGVTAGTQGPQGPQGVSGADGTVGPTGSIVSFSGNAAPTGWALCNGSAISRTTFSDLFAVIGVTYGAGDGSSTFALPDLRGRSVMGAGAGTGLTNRTMGVSGGTETVTLVSGQLPAHNHPLNAVSEAGNTGAPAGNFAANTGGLDPEYRASGTLVQMNASAIGNTGNGDPVSIVQPFLALNYIIKL